MSNPEQVAICRQRGHDALGLDFTAAASRRAQKEWTRCKWCRLWLRIVHTIEEREDDPPENEQSIFSRQESKETT